MPGISLCPGYHQVDAFGPNEEYESEEEITYVTLDLGAVEPTLVPSSSSYRLIGLDTPTPYLQLSGTIFKGQHQSLLGTELLFTDADDDHPDRTKKSLVPVGTTEQRIRFKQVELREKKEASSPELQPVGQVNKAKTKRDRIPGTLDEVAGSSVPEFAASKPRKGRKSKADSKGKGKEAEDADDGDNKSKKRKGKAKAGQTEAELDRSDAHTHTDTAITELGAPHTNEATIDPTEIPATEGAVLER